MFSPIFMEVFRFLFHTQICCINLITCNLVQTSKNEIIEEIRSYSLMIEIINWIVNWNLDMPPPPSPILE